MKFSGSFTAFVAASIATANLATAAPIGQINTQGTTQTSTSPSIQTSNSDQDNKQSAYSSNRLDYENKVDNSVDIDNSKKYDVDVDHRENTDVDIDATRNEKVYKPTFVRAAPVKPARSAPVKAVPVKAAPVKAAPVKVSNKAEQDNEFQELQINAAPERRGGAAFGAQGASANGQGGSSFQGQSNTPVVSGAGNSITTGGAQGAENNGTVGNITQKLLQQITSRGLGTMFGLSGGAPAQGSAPSGGSSGMPGFASAGQLAGANGFGGLSKQGQSNRPILSGTGNSLTAGGSQGAKNSGKGGEIGQEPLQKLGAQKRQFGGLFGAPAPQGGKAAYDAQDASANGQGGYSSQLQSNRPVVSGFGNSVTTGGSQGATNNGQGGSITQSLEQLLSRDVQAQGQGVGQGTQQFADSNARGGNAFVAGANGPVFLDGSAKGGVVDQTSGSKQQAAQSASQDASYTSQNNFAARPYYARAVQGQGQGIGQGTGQYGSAAASGGNAFVAGANGPVYIKTAAQGSAVQQHSASEQEGYQSGTQGLSSTQQNNAAYQPWFRRDAQRTALGSSQSTN